MRRCVIEHMSLTVKTKKSQRIRHGIDVRRLARRKFAATYSACTSQNASDVFDHRRRAPGRHALVARLDAVETMTIVSRDQ